MRLAKDPQNLKAVTNLIEYAFNKTKAIDQDPLFLSRYEHALGFGRFHDTTLTSFVMVNEFTSCLFQEKVKMAGIGYVASLPEYRGSGDIAAIMAELLQELKAEGYVLSELAPFSEAFYRRFGYENTIYRKTYEIPAENFQFLPSEKAGQVIRGTWQDAGIQESVKSIYQAKLSEDQEIGTVCREDWWWERLDQYYPHRHIAVILENERPTGYLIYRMLGETFLVDEMVYLTGLALKKCLTFMKAHVSSFRQFVYHAPVHEIVENCFTEQLGLKISVTPYMMSRIIDFSKLLSLISFETTLILEVTADEFCPWNIGKWRLTQAGWQKTDQAADVSASIQTWAQVLLGGQAEANRLLGKLEGEELVVPHGRVSFYDYF